MRVQMNIGIVDIFDRQGGRRTFVENFCKALQREGHVVKVVDLARYSTEELNDFDILHFSDHFLHRHIWKLLFTRHPTKILTVHGWVRKETVHTIRQNMSDLGTVARGLLSLLIWKLAPLFFDLITCPSTRTANENNLKNAVVIGNAIFPEYYAKIGSLDVRKRPDEVLLVTYSSIGGLKDASLHRLVRIVEKLNSIIKNRRVTLLIFSKDTLQGIRSKYVRNMGYSNDFLSILKCSDLFITGKSFPDLGYAEMEAGALKLPIAKFTEEPEAEEIIHNQTGILAESEDEMAGKLLDYLSDLEYNKGRLGRFFHGYIMKNKNWDSVIGLWNDLFMDCLWKKNRYR